MIKWKEKYFEELSTKELYEILRVRAEIFVVEQNCVYQDLDQVDYRSLHIFGEDDNGEVQAYLRIFEKDRNTLQMGRVLTREHGKGLGKEILKRGIHASREKMPGNVLRIEAQKYAIGFYEKEGFQVCSDEFMEDGIPHVEMKLPFPEKLADQAFWNYVEAYDRSDGKINLKIVHTFEVVKAMDYITQQLGLSEKLKELAHVCAVFHDIGRFEQLVRFNTFLDHLSVDHAQLGCRIIREQNLLSFLEKTEREQVLTAISNHNRLAIEDGITGDTLILCKLIRDADKCDIFRVFACEDLKDTMDATLEEVEQDEITDVVYECFMQHQSIDKTIRRTGLDKWVNFLAFFYDINYDESIEYLMDKRYYRYQFDRADFKKEETRKKVAIILQELEDYIGTRRK